jgi:hypothetical protein
MWDLLLQLIPGRDERDPLRQWQMWAILGTLIALAALMLLAVWLIAGWRASVQRRLCRWKNIEHRQHKTGRAPWRITLLAVVLAAPIIIALIRGVSPIGVVVGTTVLALITWVLAYNARIDAARSLSESILGSHVEEEAVGAVGPAVVWTGRNGALIAVDREELLAVSVACTRPRVLLRSPRTGAEAEVASARFGAVLQLQTRDGELVIHTSAHDADAIARTLQ